MRKVVPKLLAGVLFVSICVGAWLSFPEKANAHYFNAPGAVTSGEELRWYQASKYSGELAYADRKWGEYDCQWGSNCPGVNPERDGGSRVTVRVYDYSNCSNGTLGTFRSSTSPDSISLNRCLLDRKSYDGRKGTVMHEFGHALNSGHTPCTSYYRQNTVMVTTSCGRNWPWPGPHDKSDYYNKWIR